MNYSQPESEEKGPEGFLTPDQLSTELVNLDMELSRIMDSRRTDRVTDPVEIERIKANVEARLKTIREQIIKVRNIKYGDAEGDSKMAERAIDRLNDEVPDATEHILRLAVQLRHPDTFKEFAL